MKLSLLTKLLAPSFLVFTAVIIFIGSVSQREAEYAIKQAIMKSLEGELRGIQAGLESRMSIYEDNLLALSRSPTLLPLFTAATPEEFARLQSTLNASLKNRAFIQDGAFAFINIVNVNGKVIASSQEKKINTFVGDDATVLRALLGEEPKGTPQLAAYGLASISFCVPVVSGTVVVGAVQGIINFQKIAEEHIAPIKFGQSGHAFVAAPGGYILYHPDPTQVMTTPAATWLTPRMTAEKQGQLRYTWNEQPWLALFSTGARTGLTAIVKVQEDELLAPAVAAQHAVFKSIALAFVAFMVIMYVLIRHIVGSVKQVANYAETVAGGNLETSLAVRTNDEIGTLADALRHMVDGLRKLIAANNSRIAEAEQNRLLLENAMQIKEQFLARVSHEIRTPMNAIIGFSHLCLQTPLSGQQRTYIQNVHTSGLDLLYLINKILDFSVPVDETSKSEQIPFDLQILIYNLTAIYKARAEAKNLAFSASIDANTPTQLLGDPQRLRQVLSSLIDNAIKFTDTGFVTLQITCLPESERTIGPEHLLNVKFPTEVDVEQNTEQNAEQEGASSPDCGQTFELAFRVLDSGIGMAQEQLVHLFDVFAQADTSFTRKQGGLGLGLSVAKRLVESMGGHMLVNSVPAGGSTFSINLCFREYCSGDFPLTEKAVFEQTPAGSENTASSPLPSAHILLVEDNIFNQQIAIELLQQYDISITVANNGQEALEALDRERFDLVLMDIQMPVMDGLEAAMRIRANFSSLPIVALTAHSSDQDREQSRRAGMNAHLTKPVNPEELTQTLLQWIPLQCNILPQPKPNILTGLTVQENTPHIPSSLIMDANTDSVLSATKGLSHVAGNKNLYIKLLGRFLQDHTDETRKIQNSLADGDIASACRLAHTMKSVAATLGADALSAVAKQLELTLREPELPPANELNSLCAMFNTQLQRASIAIKIFLHKEGVPFASASEILAGAPSTSGTPATADSNNNASVTPKKLTPATVAASGPVTVATRVQAEGAVAASASLSGSPSSLGAPDVRGVLASTDGMYAAAPDENGQAPIRLGHQSILLVDDSPEQLIVLEEILGAEHNVHLASSGTEALQYLEDLTQHKRNEPLPDLILLDVLMPGLDGYATCKELKQLPGCKDIPIMFLTGMSDTADEARGLALGAVDYIIKPFQPELLKSRVQRHLELKHIRTNLEHMVEERTQEITLTQKVTIETLATLAEYRSLETGDHIKRTQRYVQVIAEHMSHKPAYRHVLTPKLLRDLELSAPLHDIGKVGIPDTILCKPGKLTAEEFDEMKKHTIYGHNALSAAETTLGKQSFLSVARLIAIAHHEKWDGSGYPNQLSGEDIPLVARIMAIADVYDALTTMRVYKPAFTHEQTRDIIVKDRGTHFDPGIVDAFLEQQDAFIAIAREQGT